MDYNVYWNATGAPAKFVLTSPNHPAQVTQQFTLAGWQAATGEDLHSLNVNPELMSPTYPGDNFSLMSNSPAMSSGIGFIPLTASSAGPTSKLTVSSTTPAVYPLQLLDRATGF